MLSVGVSPLQLYVHYHATSTRYGASAPATRRYEGECRSRKRGLHSPSATNEMSAADSTSPLSTTQTLYRLLRPCLGEGFCFLQGGTYGAWSF